MNARRRRSIFAAAVVAALSLVLAATASANTYNISNTQDVAAANPANGCATSPDSPAGGACTLRSAVQAANVAGGTSTINLAAGTYKLTIAPGRTDDDSAGDLNVENSQLTVHGAGSGSTVIDANFIDRAFEIDSLQFLDLNNVTVTNGRPGDLGDVSSCPTTLPQNSLGGGILALGDLTLSDDVITASMSAGAGGGIADVGIGQLHMTRTTVSNNTACNGQDQFSPGGGIEDNTSQESDTIDSSTISGNTASAFGGGIDEVGGSMTITDTTISNNTATSGGGVQSEGGEGPGAVTFFGDTLSGNTANNGGSGADGGGIDNSGDNDTITNTTITGNTATDGGGVASASGTTAISFSTITSNTATGTFAANPVAAAFVPSSTGNLQNLYGGSFTLDDTIVARGISPDGANTNCGGGGGFTSNGHNLLDDTGDNGNQCGAVPADLVTSNLGLDALANNGGPTQTEAITLASPARNAADDALCTSETMGIDQRGVPRPEGPHCDIGAFELRYSDVGVTASAHPSTISLGGQSTVTDTITNHGPSTATDVEFTDPATANFKIISAHAAQGSCKHTSKTVSCKLGTLKVGASTTVTIVLKDNSTSPIKLSSSVGADQSDPRLSNNDASVKIKTISDADLALTKTASPTHLSAHHQTRFTLTVLNRGPATDTGVVLTDKLPDGLTFVSAKPSQGKCSGAGKLSCQLGTLRKGARATVRLTARASRTGTIRNTAHVSGKLKEPDLKNNTASASVFVTCAQNLVFTTHWMAADKVHTVKVYLDGRHTQTLHGANLRRVKVRPVPMNGMHSVTVMFIIGPTEIVTATRSYNGCGNGPTHYSYPPQTLPGAS